MGQWGSVHADVEEEQDVGPHVVFTESVIKRLVENVAKTKDTEVVKNMNQERALHPEHVNNPEIADRESVLTKNKNYWKKRLDDLKEHHEKVKTVLEAERLQGYKDVEGTLGESKGKTEEKVFEEKTKLVQSCYKENGKETLNCEKEVADFVTCVKTKMVEYLKPKNQE